jgi:colicin import membrane protein
MNALPSMHRLFALTLALLCLPSGAASADPERRRLAEQKAAVEARFRASEAECRQRFVVVACVDEAKAQRRKELAVLREQELVIDDADRKQRAAARRADIAEKQAQAAQRAASSALPAAPKASAPRAPMSAPGATREPAATAPAPLDGGPAQAAQRAQKTNARQQEAELRRQRIAAREASKAAQQKANPSAAKKAAALPAVPALSASAARP